MTQMKRQLVHRRRIESFGFLRDDGLWEVEANMQDLKTQDVFREFDGSIVLQGSPFHDISVRLTLDDSFLIKDVSVSMDAFPFPGCGGAVPSFDVIKGTRIGAGWNRWLKQTFNGKVGCTHVLELFPVAATTAFQTMWQPLSEKYPSKVPMAVKQLVNTCQGWSDDGPMVQKLVDEQVLTLPSEEVQS
ncbi:DUF2889 domain-containing protein [Marinomonas posidonica]|uniref:Dihydroxyacid dehydratase/phosphogluconate dehydratase n=1 Tax=Marinomonas posidonica (strain CECT 7376 / NCIMB 14433 / IVIA-Po-181) TaxID=491952 RepID=F6CUB5_MARPP|nr:DUF2889 domain-containing protein [Marinomonas posidonica]AEF55234.1 dihydroxyacid dehydratase/phosphogluconate dehydratase [Marinomonas posidonica IVIA-Po-181]